MQREMRLTDWTCLSLSVSHLSRYLFLLLLSAQSTSLFCFCVSFFVLFLVSLSSPVLLLLCRPPSSPLQRCPSEGGVSLWPGRLPHEARQKPQRVSLHGFRCVLSPIRRLRSQHDKSRHSFPADKGSFRCFNLC